LHGSTGAQSTTRQSWHGFSSLSCGEELVNLCFSTHASIGTHREPLATGRTTFFFVVQLIAWRLWDRLAALRAAAGLDRFVAGFARLWQLTFDQTAILAWRLFVLLYDFIKIKCFDTTNTAKKKPYKAVKRASLSKTLFLVFDRQLRARRRLNKLAALRAATGLDRFVTGFAWLRLLTFDQTAILARRFFVLLLCNDNHQSLHQNEIPLNKHTRTRTTP
jgi:hypothetical protein